MNIYIDIDNTITITNGTDYANSTPIINRIDMINKLYDDGNIITFWTGRGTVTQINWEELTVTQLKKWGAKYHKLLFGKPPYDMFIDDKSFNSETFFK
jgi:hypothetical protein